MDRGLHRCKPQQCICPLPHNRSSTRERAPAVTLCVDPSQPVLAAPPQVAGRLYRALPGAARFSAHMAEHEPYIPATHFPAELTPRALILGVLLGLIFSAWS